MRTEAFMAILIMALATFLTRFTSLAVLEKTGIPSWFQRLLKHVPTAMLTALIAPALLAPRGSLELSAANHYLVAGVVAAVMAYRRSSPIVTMGTGIATMFFLRTI